MNNIDEARIEELKDLIRQVVTDMYSEIAFVANETANVTGNVAGFDTKVWGKPKKKNWRYDTPEDDD